MSTPVSERVISTVTFLVVFTTLTVRVSIALPPRFAPASVTEMNTWFSRWPVLSVLSALATWLAPAFRLAVRVIAVADTPFTAPDAVPTTSSDNIAPKAANIFRLDNLTFTFYPLALYHCIS